MIIFDNVKFAYQYEQFELLKGVSFALEQEVNTILCDEQSGKSTICKLLCNQIAPQSGSITIDGIQCNANKDNGVLWLPQNPAFFEGRSVLFNIAYPLKVRKVAKLQRDIIAKQLAEQFGLPANTKVKKLSSEQKRALALARGLTLDRKVVLFDDFFQDKQQLDEALQLFPDAIKVVLTSNTSLAMGHTVVLDCGECAFQGGASDAVAKFEQLQCIVKE